MPGRIDLEMRLVGYIRVVVVGIVQEERRIERRKVRRAVFAGEEDIVVAQDRVVNILLPVGQKVVVFHRVVDTMSAVVGAGVGRGRKR